MKKLTETFEEILKSLGSCTADYNNECTFQDAYKPGFWDEEVKQLINAVKEYNKQVVGEKSKLRTDNEIAQGMEEGYNFALKQVQERQEELL